jgi:hypothetical protein
MPVPQSKRVLEFSSCLLERFLCRLLASARPYASGGTPGNRPDRGTFARVTSYGTDSESGQGTTRSASDSPTL